MITTYGKETVNVIIPMYNEERTVGEVLRRVLSQEIVDRIIVVDDCSKDASVEIVMDAARKNAAISLLRNKENHGKGYSVRRGIEHVKEGIVIVQDADLEYYPEDYPKLLKAGDKETVIFGTRMIGENTGHKYILAKFANAGLTSMFNLLFGRNITDVNTCYKIFRKSMLKGDRLTADGFMIDYDIAITLARKGYKFVEVPIRYKGRTYEQGKKIKTSDAIKGIIYIFKERLSMK